MMRKRDGYYMHQQFLMNVDTSEVSLPHIETIPKDSFLVQDFRILPNLFDVEDQLIRKVPLSFILEEIDTPSDWDRFSETIKYVDILQIVIDIVPSPLPVLQQYYFDTIKSLIVLFSENTHMTIEFVRKT